MSRLWLIIAGLAGATAVALAAYGAHGFGGSAIQQSWFATAQAYHALHAVALLAGAALVDRLSGGAARAAHTGLGLCVVRRNIEAAGGAVKAVNRPGGGLSVEVTLPLAR